MGSGLGFDALGTTPAGLPALAPTPVIPPPIIESSAASLARQIDPATGDIVTDAYGRPRMVSGVRQRVQLAIATRLGSAVTSTLGNTAYQVRDIGDSTPTDLKTRFTAALQPMVSDGSIAILSIVSAAFAGPVPNQSVGLQTTIRWQDLTAAGSPTYTELVS